MSLCLALLFDTKIMLGVFYWILFVLPPPGISIFTNAPVSVEPVLPMPFFDLFVGFVWILSGLG